MTKVMIEDALVAKLITATEGVAVCNTSGRVLGYFIPAAEYDESQYAGITSPYSDEELERRENEPGGSTLAEIWQRLDPK